MKKRLIEMILEIINPMMETPRKVRKIRLDLRSKRIAKSLKNTRKKIFNPDITVRSDPMNEI